MAASALPLTSPFHFTKPHNIISPLNAHPLILIQKGKKSLKSNLSFSSLNASSLLRPPFAIAPSTLTQTRASSSSDECFDPADEAQRLLLSEEKPVKFAFWVIFWASLSLAWFAVSRDANAAVESSIKASGFSLNIANWLRKFGLPDWVGVFTLATLPVLEFRGAIPVGYWMQLNPVTLTVLSILGNMVPVPFILLYLKKFFGVVFAGLLVNLLVNLGLKYAIITGIILFFVSTFMWSILRNLKKGLSSSN
ncbi:hypothetical protein glysoja_025441 [Glycine soja]|uniref:Uncharacterized protein n=1 Tax=Glycine soja TaxID=3848 RepID=A0A0B2RAD7_GLYSO|nr:hypothetical protein glysoja_025441 [Glycine soja]